MMMLLRRKGTFGKIIFVNAVVGGVRILKTEASLPILLAILSNLRNQLLPFDLITFGEVNLFGETCHILNSQECIRETIKHGFKCAIFPKFNASKNFLEGIVIRVVNYNF